MKIGILTGGGPAPGFNGVINGVTLSALARGWQVVGITQGYANLISGNTDACQLLTADSVAGIETRGGSVLRTSRANPTKKPEDMAAAVESVRALGLDAIVTVGGDDTATAAAAVADAVGGGVRVAHVPKTIDNDLPLPGEAPTFGFETAKNLGAQLCRNLRVDAQTTGRWYLVTAMGRSAGHLALSMAVGSGADLVTVPEEYEDGVSIEHIADLVEAAIAKRGAEGHDWGLVVLGEGILDRLHKDDLATIAKLELDEHGNPRMSEIDLGRAVRDIVDARLKQRGVKVGFVTKLIGYELRCADPTAFDVQYTRTLGTGAVEFLANGTGNGIICLNAGKLQVLRFEDLRDEASGRVPVRRLDLTGSLWRAAIQLQARLSSEDLQGPRAARLAEAVGLDEAGLAGRWGYLVKD